jgi:hypothetical protein
MPQAQSTQPKITPGAALAQDLMNRVADLLVSAERAGKPVEIDPYRSQLFELFVMADAAGFLTDDTDHDLTCDAIGRELAARWELAKAIGPGGLSQPGSLPAAQLARVRLLWSFMRMWMEWTYAWKRWDEFHSPGAPVTPQRRGS